MQSLIANQLGHVEAQATNSDDNDDSKGKMSVKVYLVLTKAGEGEQVIDAKLTWKAADNIASKIEGAFTRKLVATK